MSDTLQLLLEQYDDGYFAARARGESGRLHIDGYYFHSPKARGDFRDIVSEKLRGDHDATCAVTHSIAKTEAPILFVPDGTLPSGGSAEEWTRQLETRLACNARELAAAALRADTGESYTGEGPLLIALAPFRDIDLARELAKSVHAGEPRIHTEPLATLAYLGALHGEGKARTVAAVAVSRASTLVTLVHNGGLAGAETLDNGFNDIFAAIQAQLNLKFIGSAAKLVYDGIYDFSEVAVPVLKDYSAGLRASLGRLAAGAGVQPEHLVLTRVPPAAGWIEAQVAERLELTFLPAESPKPVFESETRSLEAVRGFLPLWHTVDASGGSAFARVDWRQAVSLPEVLKALPVRAAAAPAAAPTEKPAAATKAAPAADTPPAAKNTTAAADAPPREIPAKPAEEKSAPPPPAPSKKVEKATPVPVPATDDETDRKKPFPLIIGGAVAALLVLGIAAFFLFSGDFGEEPSIALAPPASAERSSGPAAAPDREARPAPESEPEPEPAPEAEPAPERDPVGALTLATVPEGATVTLGGEAVGTTPLRLDELPSGRHTVTLELAGHEPLTLEAEVTDGETTAPGDIELRAFSGTLAVESGPAGAAVRLNGEDAGTTPLLVESMPVGTYEVTVELDGYEPESIEAVVADRETTTLNNFKLRPVSGSLAVRSSPEGIAFRLVPAEDSGLDEIAESTPADLEELPPGGYRVIFEREDWPKFTRPVTVRRNERAEVLMEYPEARLTIETEPEGAEVWTGETLLGTTPLALEGLRPQRMRCLIRHENYLPEEVVVELEPNGEHNHTLELVSVDGIFSPDQVDVLPLPRDNRLPDTAVMIMRPETVMVRFVVGRDGKPDDITIQSSTNNRLNNLVLDIVNDWTFEPAVLRETPVRVRVVAPIVFNPPERAGRRE